MQNMILRLKNIGICTAMVLGGMFPSNASANTNAAASKAPKLLLQAAPANVKIINTSNWQKEILFYYNPRTVSHVIGYNAVRRRDVIHQDIIYDSISALGAYTFINQDGQQIYLIPGTITEKYDGHKINYFYNTDEQFDKYWNILAKTCNLADIDGKITLQVVFCEQYTGITAIHNKSVIASMCMRASDNVPVIYVIGEKIELFRNCENKNSYTIQCNGRSKTLPSNAKYKQYITNKKHNGR